MQVGWQYPSIVQMCLFCISVVSEFENLFSVEKFIFDNLGTNSQISIVKIVTQHLVFLCI